MAPHSDVKTNHKNGVLSPSFDDVNLNSPAEQGTLGKIGKQLDGKQVVGKQLYGKQVERRKSDPFAVILDGGDDLEHFKSNPFLNILKVICVFGLLYLFICSLDFMASSFRLISGKSTGHVMQNEYIRNPVVGVMIGILVTVLVQSSSTSTSIIVSMVNSEILYVREAIPMIMGSNIGTSVTNTIVSLTQISDRNQFRRAFAGATVHDMFNWLSVITLFCIEVSTHMLEKLTNLIVRELFVFEGKQTATNIKILKHITEPFSKLVIQIDKKVLTGWSKNDPAFDNLTLNPCYNTEFMFPNDTEKIEKKCNYLFAMLKLDDTRTGIILLIASLFILCFALIMIVRILKSMLKGAIATMIKRVINSDIPYVPWVTGYFAILIGAVMTVIVQSSSIFTSTLTPLIGLGLISVDRAYPLTLGSNIGTTTTALFASIAGEGLGLQRSVQIALVHLFFNVIGILIFYPIPFMRFPIPLAKGLGNITAKYRWFAILYLIGMFFLLPMFVFVLSLGGLIVLESVGIPILILLLLVILTNVLQKRAPKYLPPFLRTWEFLPLPLHSLEPYDKVCLSLPCCKSCRTGSETSEEPIIDVEKFAGLDNPTFDTEHTKL